ncbi:MAG: murein biosynthesis integral membrane protein MurJ, partial [Clostridia bacterium]|nr:murein biosynthesis integral membrane protein MurJ [Clostridia bacterium]
MKKTNFLSAIGSVMVIMIASRLLALFSSQVYMSVFGTDNIYINIYSYAINIPNIIFTCIGTALSTVVIPIYVGHKATGENDKAKKFADNIISVSLVLTFILVIFGICISPLLVNFTGFSKDADSKVYATKALMIVMPVMFFYALNYIFQGMLQSEGCYKLPAFVSVPSSLVVILYVFLLSDSFGVTGLLYASVLGLSLQALILIPPLYRQGYRYRVRFKLNDPDIINAAKMAVPVLVGVGAYQLNMLFNSTMIARYDKSMVTILTFVQNITIQMVLALVYSITAVIYPRLSESYAKGDTASYKETLGGILKNVSVILIPLTFGYISVREPLLNLLVAWGKVSPDAVKKAEIFLSFYAIGILGIGLKEILDRALYSVKNTKISAVNGFLIMFVNIALSLLFMPHIGAFGIPLSYSLASLLGVSNLLFQLKRKVGSYAKGLLKEILKSILLSALMWILVYFLLKALNIVFPSEGFIARIIKLGAPAFIGALFYLISAYFLKNSFVRDFADKIFKKV